MSAVSRPSPPISLDDRFVRDPKALSAEVDGEAVALDVTNGVCFGFDPIATRVWALMASPITVADICASLMMDYDVAPDVCHGDVRDLLRDLRAEGLILVATGPSSSAA